MRRLPSTRYIGSKRKIVGWIWRRISRLNFNSVLDAFGGTGVVGYYLKCRGKRVVYNDVLKFNYLIGLAVIENNHTRLSVEDVDFILRWNDDVDYDCFIEENFRGLYYTDEENRWLDMVVANINSLGDKYKRALAFSALIQACLVKRPFNLFHRGNLKLRLNNVKRSFGNHYVWRKPFPELFRKFVDEYNSLVFSNGLRNRALNQDVFDLEVDVDLVYLDPPYLRRDGRGVDYRMYYHFLEGLVNYDRWGEMIDPKSSIKALRRSRCPWTSKRGIREAFLRLFEKFQDVKYIVLSYRSGGIPSRVEILGMLRKFKGYVKCYSTRYKYALSNDSSRELLFIAY